MNPAVVKPIISGVGKAIGGATQSINNVAGYCKEKVVQEGRVAETNLKAIGFTVQHAFSQLSVSEQEKDFILDYRDSATLEEKRDLIKQSSELSDEEKLDKLDQVFIQEEQLNQESAHLLQVKRSQILVAGLIIILTTTGTALVFNKKLVTLLPKAATKSIALLGKAH